MGDKGGTWWRANPTQSFNYWSGKKIGLDENRERARDEGLVDPPARGSDVRNHRLKIEPIPNFGWVYGLTPGPFNGHIKWKVLVLSGGLFRFFLLDEARFSLELMNFGIESKYIMYVNRSLRNVPPGIPPPLPPESRTIIIRFIRQIVKTLQDIPKVKSEKRFSFFFFSFLSNSSDQL